MLVVWWVSFFLRVFLNGETENEKDCPHSSKITVPPNDWICQPNKSRHSIFNHDDRRECNRGRKYSKNNVNDQDYSSYKHNKNSIYQYDTHKLWRNSRCFWHLEVSQNRTKQKKSMSKERCSKLCTWSHRPFVLIHNVLSKKVSCWVLESTDVHCNKRSMQSKHVRYPHCCDVTIWWVKSI